MKNKEILITVRWWDGYLETFNVFEKSVRAGAYLLYFITTNGNERRIPVQQVRWYYLGNNNYKL